jgi:hypothetical protein
MNNPAVRIIDKCGGPSKLSRAMGHRFPSKVSKWKTIGIPSNEQANVIKAARTLGVTITPDDFFDLEDLAGHHERDVKGAAA